MKKNLITSIAVVVGMVLFSAVFATAGEILGDCRDKQAVQQFKQETAALTSALETKEDELGDEYIYTISEASKLSGPDYRKINVLESEIKELKNKIDAAAKKYGVQACCCNG